MNSQKNSISDEVRHIHVPGAGAHLLYFAEYFECTGLFSVSWPSGAITQTRLGKMVAAIAAWRTCRALLNGKLFCLTVLWPTQHAGGRTGKVVARWVSLPPSQRDFV